MCIYIFHCVLCINIYVHISFIVIKEENPAICDNVDETGGHFAKRSKQKTDIAWSHLYVESRIKVLKSSGYQRLAGGGKCKILIKGYQLSVIRWINPGAQMYNMVTILSNNVLYTGNLPRK